MISRQQEWSGWVAVLNDESAPKRPLYLTADHTFSPSIEDARFWTEDECGPNGPDLWPSRTVIPIRALHTATTTHKRELL